VPEDVSVVGYDDIPLARDLTPELITVHVDYEELGRTAVRYALNRERHAMSSTSSSVRPGGNHRLVNSRGVQTLYAVISAVGIVLETYENPPDSPPDRRSGAGR
jgi:hypothetical protein